MKYEINDIDGYLEHCRVAALILAHMDVNPHTKHHIRSAVREATLKVTLNKGSGKAKASTMSENARKQMIHGNSNNLVLEHVVPVSYINSLILDLIKPSTDQIAQVIYEWTILSVITKSEHQALSDLGLSKKMPDDWDGINKLARYEQGSIQLVLSEYKKLKQLTCNPLT